MITRIANLWYGLRSTFWFVPGLMATAAVLLSLVTDALDERYSPGGAGWIYGGSPAGARELISAVAASMITIAGVSFSVMIVALSLASQQFGPRLLRNFMRDTGNQLVLGMFIGTFLYCLLVLRRIRGADGADVDTYVPGISITITVLLAVLSVAFLIYFIHHAASSIQANNVVAAVGRELEHAVGRLFPGAIGRGDGEAAPDERALEAARRDTAAIPASASGYIQAVDGDALLAVARDHDVLVWVDHRPGQYVVEGGPLGGAGPAAALTDEGRDKLRSAFLIGAVRTADQDAEFAIEQIVQIAVRALSPGVNDPFTAMACIDALTAALVTLAESDLPGEHRYDDGGRLRVIVTSRVQFAGAMDAAFNQIRQTSTALPAVPMRLLEALETLASRVRSDEQVGAVTRHAAMTYRAALNATSEEHDREDLRRRHDRVTEALAQRRRDDGRVAVDGVTSRSR